MRMIGLAGGCRRQWSCTLPGGTAGLSHVGEAARPGSRLHAQGLNLTPSVADFLDASQAPSELAKGAMACAFPARLSLRGTGHWCGQERPVGLCPDFLACSIGLNAASAIGEHGRQFPACAFQSIQCDLEESGEVDDVCRRQKQMGQHMLAHRHYLPCAGIRRGDGGSCRGRAERCRTARLRWAPAQRTHWQRPLSASLCH